MGKVRPANNVVSPALSRIAAEGEDREDDLVDDKRVGVVHELQVNTRSRWATAWCVA